MKPFHIVLFISTYLVSCSTIKYFPIQVLHPAQLSLLHDSIEINIIDKNECRLEGTFKINNVIPLKFIKDSFIQSVKVNLQQSPLLVHSKINVVKELNGKQSPEVFEGHNFTLDIDSFYTNDNFSIFKEKNNIYNNYNQFVSKYSLYCGAHVKLFDSKGNYLDHFNFIDTINWFSDILRPFNDQFGLPDIPSASGETGRFAGIEYAHRLVPYWILDERMIYCDWNHGMRAGYKAFLKNNLLLAIDKWKRVFHKGKEIIASHAAFNIALAYELMDDFENAEIWINYSNDLFHTQDTEDYRLKLQQRLKFKEQLDKQF